MNGPVTPTLVLIAASLLAPVVCAESNAIVERPQNPDRPMIAETFVNQKLWLWQKRLRLQDWKITIKMAHRSDLKPKTLGNVHWDTNAKTATIRVMHPEDYDMPFNEILDDLEVTVVHELVHLHLASLPRSESTKGAEEQAVNLLSDALITLERRK